MRQSARAKIASSILAIVVVEDRRIESFRPRPSWAPYFEELAQNVRSKRETSLELATSTLATLRSTN